ncbi:hypothetical protein SCUCBS95973_002931 [Sporothrix curviconia]|uniref:Uncharacterized protein n=1 Tax=Sporothrix curviconia TaxID=1260050 RepID=A0ABP0BB05_9PEZI
MIPLQRSLSSPVNDHSSLPPPNSNAHGLPRSPTPSLHDSEEKYVGVPRRAQPVPTTRSAARIVEGALSYHNRRSDGTSARRTSAGPLTMPPTLTNLMVSSKTTAAAATTATVTATATTVSTLAGMPILTYQGGPLAGPLASASVALPPLAAVTDVRTIPGFPPTPPHRLAVTQHRPPIPPPSHGLPAHGLLAAPSPRGVMSGPKLVSSSESEASPPTSPAGISDMKYQFSTNPLLQDPSQYTGGRVAAEYQGTSLNELAHLVRLSKYQERKRTQTRTRLQLNLISTVLSSRLVRCGDMAHRNLTECFRGDDRTGFANLYNAVHNVRKSCDELRKYALFEPELEALRSPASTESLDTATAANSFTGNAATSAGPPSLAAPFLNDVSAEARQIFISFLTSLRNNPDYLATRLCSLSTAELSALTSFSQGMEPIDSVLPFHSRPSSSTRTSSSTSGRSSSTHNSVSGGHGKEANHVQMLLSFQRHDPLSALIHTCFANSAGPDSAEDRRRTDIWASACARLISEKGAGGEPVLVAVLNAWSAMREWSGRSSMEWFLMKILEDGAFLLDRAEDQNGTRFNLNEWTTKDQIAAEEFYDRAIKDLFDVIDDEDMTGIPEGLIELGNQILRKLDAKFVDNTRSWLVSKWLFGTWLLSVVIHPETYGLMAEYHITEYGRQKILKEVALRAQRLVVEKTMTMSNLNGAKPVSTPLANQDHIKTNYAHIENIVNRFRDSKAHRPVARLLPARSITSLRETVEVHPYLVVSPADLVTMVNALFPERRPRSAQSGSLRSGSGSVSNFSVASQPVAVSIPRSNADAYSVLSTSVSSANSDATTSVEPLLESQQTGTSSYRSSPPPSFSLSGGDQRRLNHYEDDGYRLRLAVQDMVHFLGRECVRGACHPCAERWAVLFISADGNSLSMHMTYDHPDGDDEDVEEDTTSSSDETDDTSEDDEQSGPDKTELDTDYHQLRNCILKLVEEYEIPQALEASNGVAPTFSNRANRLKKYRLKNKVVTMETTASSPHVLQSRNPYLRRVDGNVGDAVRSPPTHRTQESRDSQDSQDSRDSQNSHGTRDQRQRKEPEATEPVLISMLEAASSQSRSQSDFLSAHQYWKTIQQLNALSSDSLRKNGFAALLNIFSRGPRDSIRRSAAAVEEYEAWLIWLKQSQERAEGALDTMTKRLRALRDKMWYVTDVRNSAPYEFTRNIAVALKTMGTSRKWDAYQRSRQNKPRGPAASYLYRTESELVELLAATEGQGGPNKLSDDQAEKTLRWLQHYGIANFCQGEERIHRFSCEIASCADKLIGESIVEAPVLWSSDLFLRDRRYLETTGRSGARDRDVSGTLWDDASSIRSFDSDNRRFNTSSGRPSSSLLRGDRDLRASLSQSNASTQSFDSGRYSFSRASTSFSEVLGGGQDYFSGGLMSPVPAIDASTTFWSPFQLFQPAPISSSAGTSRAQSPTASSTNLSSPFAPIHQTPRRSLFSRHQGDGVQTPPSHMSSGRPGTSASSSVDTVFQQRMSEEKVRFLSELRQTLTSLLLSDLGNLVFARGSETDHWFGSLGQECIERREAIEKRQRHEAVAEKKRRSNRNSLKHIAVDNNERKNELGESWLSAAGSNAGPAGCAVSAGGDMSPSAMSRRSHTSDAAGSSHGNDSSATASDHTAMAATAARHDRSPLHTATKAPTTSTTRKTATKTATTSDFPFTKAYTRLLRMFCVHPNPQAKLAALFELENLITASLSSRSTRRRLALLTKSGTSPVVSHATATGSGGPFNEESTTTTILGSSSSRVKPLEEAIDNIKGRRSSTLGARQQPTLSRRGSVGVNGERITGASAGAGAGYSSSSNNTSQTKDAVACILQSLFCDPTIRPKTLFRDLQFIAAFVPSDVLDRSERGKSFWAAGLAALLLKSEVCTTMIEVADEIVGVYTKTRKAHAPPPPPPPPPSAASGDGSNSGSPSMSYSTPLPLSSSYSLADAARMLTITAKEGDATSQRELAIFYLSNPELVERTTLPLSKPREVFKKTVMDKYGGGSSSSGGGSSGMSGHGLGGGPGGHGHGHGHGYGHGPGDNGVYDVRNDPALMCVAIHWMEAAEQGGDELARTFLGQNEMIK